MTQPAAQELHLQVQNRLFEELLARQRNFETHIELLEEIVLRCDGDGRLLLVNPAWTRRLGWPQASSLGRRFLEFLADGGERQVLESLLLGTEAISRELHLLALGGHTRTFQFRACRSGAQWFGSLHDVTELRTALDARERSELSARKLAMVASRTDNMVIITDPRGMIEWVNAGFERVSGYTLAEAEGRSPGELLQGPDTDPGTIETMRRGIQEGTGFNVEILNYSRDGRRYWNAIECVPVLNSAGAVTQFIAIERDITELRATQQRLATSERLHRRILAAVSEPIFQCDPRDFRIIFANPAWTRAINGDGQYSDGRSLLEFVHPEDRDAVKELVADIQCEKPTRRLEIRINCGNASYRRHELEFTGSGCDTDAPVLTGAMVDIEERWRAARELERAREEAERLTQTRTRFVANMSHEIRTPLNAIIGMSEMLESTRLDAAQRESLETIREGGRALLALVNDILDFAKIDAGQLELESAPFDVLGICEQSIALIADAAVRKGLAVRLTAGAGVPALSLGDSHRVRQVLLNLLSNALKFTAEGHIHIHVDGETTCGGRVRLTVQVADTGLGIAPDRLGRLFAPFTQADASMTREFGGTGLGLAICRLLCERMGGSIRVDSAPGRGSRFTFDILAGECVAAATAPAGRLRACGVDDTAAEVATTLARRQALTFERAEAEHGGPRLEWIAPDGQLRTVPVDQHPTVLTPDRLWRQLEPKAAPESAPSEAPATAHPLRILVAEDQPFNQTVIRAMLARCGQHDMTLVENGADALECLTSKPYDLALLDIHMPQKDGLEVARMARTFGCATRLIACTADALVETDLAIRRAGFDGAITKPFSRIGLQQVLDDAIAATEHQPDAGKAPPTANHTPA